MTEFVPTPLTKELHTAWVDIGRAAPRDDLGTLLYEMSSDADRLLDMLDRFGRLLQCEQGAEVVTTWSACRCSPRGSLRRPCTNPTPERKTRE